MYMNETQHRAASLFYRLHATYKQSSLVKYTAYLEQVRSAVESIWRRFSFSKIKGGEGAETIRKPTRSHEWPEELKNVPVQKLKQLMDDAYQLEIQILTNFLKTRQFKKMVDHIIKSTWCLCYLRTAYVFQIDTDLEIPWKFMNLYSRAFYPLSDSLSVKLHCPNAPSEHGLPFNPVFPKNTKFTNPDEALELKLTCKHLLRRGQGTSWPTVAWREVRFGHVDPKGPPPSLLPPKERKFFHAWIRWRRTIQTRKPILFDSQENLIFPLDVFREICLNSRKSTIAALSRTCKHLWDFVRTHSLEFSIVWIKEGDLIEQEVHETWNPFFDEFTHDPEKWRWTQTKAFWAVFHPQ